MALKGDRNIISDDVRYFVNTTGERGIILTTPTGAVSGLTMENTVNAAVVPGTGSQSGKIPLGVLLNDVVSLDLTRYHLNYHKDEVNVGNKVRIGRKGWVVTNMVTGTPAAFDPAYLGALGYATPTSGTGIALVGRFLTAKDADGFATLAFDIN